MITIPGFGDHVRADWPITINGMRRQRPRLARAVLEHFERAAPSQLLRVVDLAEIQHLPLHHLATGAALVLNDVPVAMLFAVFEASVESQEHANQLNPNKIAEKTLGLHYRRFHNSLH